MSDLNATYLFQRPERGCHNSESWWTAFFSMFLLHKAKTDPSFSLPVYTTKGGASSRLYPTEGVCLTCEGLSFGDVIVERRLSAQTFKLNYWPEEYRNLKPDLILFRRKQRKISLIEVKTVGSSIAANGSHQLLKYMGACEHLGKRDWTTTLYYLLSYGHERPNDWNVVQEKHLNIILWEDVLREVVNTPLAEIFVGEDLLKYATVPKEGITESRA